MRRGPLVGPVALALLLSTGATLAGSPSVPPSMRPAGLPTCAPVAEVVPPSTAQASPVPAGAAAAGSELTVFAAASLRGAFEAFGETLRSDTGIVPGYSFDASSALRTQIQQGAPADVFASADTRNVETLLQVGSVRDAVVFACNQLTIIVPAGNPAGIVAATDLARPGVAIVAAGDEVPITRYAQQLVANLGIADAYAANVVTREDNVAAVRSRVELGEGDAGIVYLTDAIASGDLVEQVPVPPQANVSATYAAAVVTTTDQPAVSSAYLGWLTGPAGQAALAAFGFLPTP